MLKSYSWLTNRPSRSAVGRFCNHSYDLSINSPPRRSITIVNCTLLCSLKKNKMAARFVNIDESAINTLKTKAENDNTKKSTTGWLKIWQQWATYRNYDTQMENYLPEELDKTLQKFYAELRTKKGKGIRTRESKSHAGCLWPTPTRTPIPFFNNSRW